MANDISKKEDIDMLAYEYVLSLEVGVIADHTSLARDDIHIVHIGSEIEPAHIGRSKEGDFDNGQSTISDFYVVVQHGVPLLVVHREFGANYGAEYQKNGGGKDIAVYKMPKIPVSNLDFD